MMGSNKEMVYFKSLVIMVQCVFSVYVWDAFWKSKMDETIYEVIY